jgi:hypothetical protein
LGVQNPDILQSIIYRGAVYADSQNFSPCLKLWNHAMKIAQRNHLGIRKDLLRFTQVNKINILKIWIFLFKDFQKNNLINLFNIENNVQIT